MSNAVQSYSETLLHEQEKDVQKNEKQGDAFIPSRRIRIGVVLTLLVTLVVVMFFCVYISAGWGNSRLSREADRYENQLNEWITEQMCILTMFTDTISAQPEIMDDYGTAVRWLDSIASHYPNISACYMANPYADIPVVMNTGWIPGEDERPETRPWYRETEQAANHSWSRSAGGAFLAAPC